MKKIFASLTTPALLSVCAITLSVWLIFINYQPGKVILKEINISDTPLFNPSPTSTPKIVLKTPPREKTLPEGFHTFQTFNNCGPASLSMALTYYGITKTQEELGQELRPYQNPQGDNDDKSVTLTELGEKAKKYGFIYYHRPNGSIELIKLFITYDIPVIARTITKEGEDIGHFRVIKGYNDNEGVLIQDDSLQGKDLLYTYKNFNNIWKAFNYEYLVLAKPEQEKLVGAILGKNIDFINSWRLASEFAEEQLKQDPNDIYARFNLSVALYNIKDYQGSVNEFEKIENKLPFRTLWYNTEPILSYFELGDYKRVFDITDKILNNGNRAFSELYIVRGEIYKKQGNTIASRQEFDKAVLYNKNLRSAQEAPKNLNQEPAY